MKTINTTAKKQATKRQTKKAETLTAQIIENDYTTIIENENVAENVQNTELVFISSLSAKELKRLANPQFSHLVSKTKKATILVEKSNLKTTLLKSKKYINVLKDTLESNDYYFENRAKLDESIKFTNYILNDKNSDLLQKFDSIVKRNKAGLYCEYKLTQSIQKVAKFTTEKNCNYNEAINYILALNYQAKKELL
jgi:hypothetical protein